MNRSRPTVALLACVLVAAPLAGACSPAADGSSAESPQPPSASAPASSAPASSAPAPSAPPAPPPEDWPAAVPFYGEGDLEKASVEPDGAARALWMGSGAATTALRTYGELLTAAGFEFVSDGTVDGIPTAEYAGQGYAVVIQAVGLEGGTSISIAATPS